MARVRVVRASILALLVDVAQEGVCVVRCGLGLGARGAPRGPRSRSSAAPLYLGFASVGGADPHAFLAFVIHNQGRGSVQDQERPWSLFVNQERQARSWDLPPSRARSVRYRGARTSESEARGGRHAYPNLTPAAQHEILILQRIRARARYRGAPRVPKPKPRRITRTHQ